MLYDRHAVNGSGIFRNALQVSPVRIAALNDAELHELLRVLLSAQSYRCGRANTIVNTEAGAADDGCDGWSARPAREDPWLGSTDTCWQCKAGSAGQPAKLRGEVTKPMPRRTLQAGGRFVVVASGSKAGEAGVRRRLDRLRSAADGAGIPSRNIEVYGSEKLAEWCNQHPAVAARWAGAPEGLQPFDDWVRSEVHRIPYQETPRMTAAMSDMLTKLDFNAQREDDRIRHLHIRGQPGVGKTRFALELCRRAPWRATVIYVRQADDVRLSELIDSAAEAPDVRLTVVADEVQPERIEPLRDSVGRTNGRVQLVTIGSCPSPDLRRIPELTIEPLDVPSMRAVISGWYPQMPPEHVAFVTGFADGYVRLGRLTADAVTEDPSATAPDLFDRSDIRRLLDRMLGDGDRRSLYVIAALALVGWTGDRQQEGKAVAAHLGLDWNEAQHQVERIHRSTGIAPRSGRYRYISPYPLAVYLAKEAWESYPDLLKSLPEALPSDGAREAYYSRLESLAGSPQARTFARDQLRFFFRIDDFGALHAARRWSAFAAADPDSAVRNLRRVLTDSSLEDRRRITFAASAEIVSRLARIASRTTGFDDAVTALALLAEAENEIVGSGASREFIAKYQVQLAGTALPYPQRLNTLDALAAQGRPALVSIVVQALAQVADDSPDGAVLSARSDRIPEPDWSPSSANDHVQCITAAVGRLKTIAAGREAAIEAALLDAAERMSWLLAYADASPIVMAFFEELRDGYPELREPLRKRIAGVIRGNEERLPAEQRQTLSRLHARFEDRSLGGRLRQRVGMEPWERNDRNDRLDARALAEELLTAPGELAREWSWLTSGQAAEAWELGAALADADTKGQLDDELPRLPDSGRDLRVVCGYVAARRRVLGDAWYERWMLAQFAREPQPAGLLLQVAWRCGSTDPVAIKVAELLRGGSLDPGLVGQLMYGTWTGIAADALHGLLRAMIDTGHGKTAIGMLRSRMEHAAAEIDRWRPLALELITDIDLIRHANRHWRKVAELIADHPREIAAAIIRAHAHRDASTSWLLRYHRAAMAVFRGCLRRDAGAVWRELTPYLWPPRMAAMFVIGFPAVLEDMPRDDVLAWIASAPSGHTARRAALLAGLTNKHMLTDDRLAARIIADYGDHETVAEAFFSRQVTGAFTGPASSRWQSLAEQLDRVAADTGLPGLRRWARRSADALRAMASRERQHEEEHELLVRAGA